MKKNIAWAIAIVAIVGIQIFLAWTKPTKIQISLKQANGTSLVAVREHIQFFNDRLTIQLASVRDTFESESKAVVASALAENLDAGAKAKAARARLALAEQQYTRAWKEGLEAADKRANDAEIKKLAERAVELGAEVSSISEEVSRIEESVASAELQTLRKNLSQEISAALGDSESGDFTDEFGAVTLPRNTTYLFIAIRNGTGTPRFYFERADQIKDGHLVLTDDQVSARADFGEWMFDALP
ncbi:MAG: hypothetical protein IT566_14220 [Rhodospirillaceae bacterium]|nr:hypothetical protein [Rhodospirillaceae bacterium]